MIVTSQDGSHTVFSERFGFTYHSKFGAITESAHIFITAGLRYRALMTKQIDILETGFGTGLNAFLTLLEAERRNLTVHYTGLETFPIDDHDAQQLNYTELLKCPDRHRDFMTLHQCDWSKAHLITPHFGFQKLQIAIETFEAVEKFDLIYFDAFAPQAQPELWTVDVMERMYHALRPEGVLVTYCAKGEFKRNLKKAGFEVEALSGPPGKREMTRALK
jgi:tRNA U34 5-methylaminomethyl-2-thiouridine-forming methyltransferase MnmC